MQKFETIEEFLARGGIIQKVSRSSVETKTYGNRTLKNTKKSEWNKLKAWKLKRTAEVANG